MTPDTKQYIEEVRADGRFLTDRERRLLTLLDESLAREERMREALEWYANRLDSRCANESAEVRVESCREVIQDGGYRARAALSDTPPAPSENTHE